MLQIKKYFYHFDLLSFDPLSFDPLSIDPVSFDLLSVNLEFASKKLHTYLSFPKQEVSWKAQKSFNRLLHVCPYIAVRDSWASYSRRRI